MAGVGLPDRRHAVDGPAAADRDRRSGYQRIAREPAAGHPAGRRRATRPGNVILDQPAAAAPPGSPRRLPPRAGTRSDAADRRASAAERRSEPGPRPASSMRSASVSQQRSSEQPITR